ncbi:MULTISPECIES: DUF2612 domain-containing protein [unclassified Beijerinckia]|uniref:DUF2612 domain-containing protein n=1 Tax=unclassified Beijerinckia TaxID=2638183 RepID=UPI0008949211|nr:MULTISPECIES: DUF2612 domain-containing protein [unclassified Beijerinckia]MDH7794133.1 hypothetical protein [Beijerinckia sp. GAS462]SEB54016.1 Protein of unknown function [Beijerinckia sp. 28-YEA-48]
MIQARYAFGEDFRFSRFLDLPFGYVWRAAATLRDETGAAIGPLNCQITGIEPSEIVVSATAAAVASWPRPAPSGERTFYFDYEVSETDGGTVMSSETAQLLVEYNTAFVGDIVSREFQTIPTEYREAHKLLGYMRAVLAEVEAAAQATARIPTFFDIDSAVGDQLTIIGKWLGFPRCHCICIPNPVFGFDCGGADAFPGPIVGFCDGGNWLGCDGGSLGEYCIADDEVYRGFLKARRYQMLGLFDRESLTAAIRHVWGPSAYIIQADRCRVVVAPGRPLGPDEVTRNQILARILPVAPGLSLAFWIDQRPVFGFGDGWAGMCDPPQNPTKVFGFDCGGDYAYNITGFCATGSTWANCVPPAAGRGVWLCPDDAKATC